MTKTWNDHDPIETKEWLDALKSVIRYEGKDRASFLLTQLAEAAEQQGLYLSKEQLTSYCNTIAAEDQPEYPGNLELEAKIESAIRWNAIAMVVKTKKGVGGVGGHLSSFASIATLYEVGLNHFFKADEAQKTGDLIYFQGHSSEGNYARAFLEGRMNASQLNNFRQEIDSDGLSSYPHPWLMPDYWQFATVSLGLGMMQGVYQVRFMKYLDNRKLKSAGQRKVWVFCGDGEMDEPDSIGGLTLAAREKLDNLIFVINCNLQRLDGLVRSNYKIVNELEKLFRGAGWNVIKVLWGSAWDKLFAKDKAGLLIKRLGEMVDGDLQTASAHGGAYMRDFIFNTPDLQALVADWSDSDIAMLKRGAHDPVKIYAAYQQAVNHQNQPTVILAQGVKGFGLGTSITEGRNIAHNQLDMSDEDLKVFRDRFNLPLTDKQLLNFEFYRLAPDSAEAKYLHERRKELGGYIPVRSCPSLPLNVPKLDAFETVLKGTGERTMSTTMVLGRILTILLKDKEINQRIVPIFSDEVRTFGLETLFRQVGIYSPIGQLYTPEDKEQFLYYHETQEGQVLEEGITEAGCMASWIAAATSYANHNLPMIPFFTYYSMFGFQRVGDYIWAACDMRARGFLIGATAGRTTLEGEGLQHQDGSSLLTASTFPSCRAYDPAFSYEMAVIVQQGLKEMFVEEQDVFYYIMAMNERYEHPDMPAGVEQGIIKGMYLFKAGEKAKHHVQLLGSGAILNEVIAAAQLLESDFKISADIWSVTSYSELRREGLSIERKNMFSQVPTGVPYVTSCFENRPGPIVAASDYVRATADLIRPFIPAGKIYTVLGTDGYGRSDTREKLRYFFEVNRYYIVIAALASLVKEGKLEKSIVTKAMEQYKLNPMKQDPLTV